MALSTGHFDSALSGTVIRVEEYGGQYGIVFSFGKQNLTAINNFRNWMAGGNMQSDFLIE